MASSKSIDGIRSIYHDPDYYVKSFKAFSDLSSRLSLLESWVETVFPTEVVLKLPAVAEGTMKMLGVGTGRGETDRGMIDQLHLRFQEILNVVAEPTPAYVEDYKQVVLNRPIPGVTFDFRVQTFEDYRKDWEKETDRPKFEFISAVHSIYYMKDIEKSVMNMHEMLKEGGVMLIIVLADDSGFGRLWRKFPMFADEIQKHALTDTMREILTKNGVKHEVIRQSSKVDISCCFEEGNEQGKLITDFLAHVIDLEKSAPEELVKEFFDYLGGTDCSVRKGGKVMFNNSWDAVIARK